MAAGGVAVSALTLEVGMNLASTIRGGMLIAAAVVLVVEWWRFRSGR